MCVICVCRPRPPSMLVLLVPRKIVILAFIFWGEWEGRQRISSCYRLRPSSEATPMHLGAKTNTQETRHANTHTHTHPNTLSHTPTHCIHWAAFCFAFKAALFRVCVFALICFCLFHFFAWSQRSKFATFLPLVFRGPFWPATVVVLVLPNFVYGQRNGNWWKHFEAAAAVAF